MASESVSHLIFFIAAIVVASSMAAIFVGTGYQMAESIGQESADMQKRLESRITIINDPVMMPYRDHVLTIYVENIGDGVIPTSSLTVLLDGTYMGNVVFTVIGGGGIWGPSTVLQVDIEEPLAEGDHSVRITTSEGASAELRFRI
ncbi:MAG: hypothetical protein HPY73_01640 [Methanomassiliicoccales archaeon]|nr:MAG: hypothetical protein HPY73_01640 [Methanomassiliicoccales archaeon]